ncbi:MAG: nucleotide sugar dehydrogenase [Gammaproteobacteria bacterium]|nr:nucleotide sugar dehydrogenase [Gammaproteobacteria bacterium]
MKISVFGLGYVGAVSAACLARDGHQVIGVDPSETKVHLINTGRSPIVEQGLEDLIAAAVAAGRLRAVTGPTPAIADSDLTFVCVGTPSESNGSLDLRFVRSVCEEIGACLRAKGRYHVVVIRSTILPGTMRSVVIPAIEAASGLVAGRDFGVCNNPEFLREGTAIHDYDHPPKTVIGMVDERAGADLRGLYEKLTAPMICTAIETAEMVKYVDNVWHALKVGFANEIGSICKCLDIDSHDVMDIFCQDRKLNISPYYLKPGFAFGGSCLPKDVSALSYEANRLDLQLPILGSIMDSNRLHIERALQLIMRNGRRRIGILGLSFKAGTDDLRHSPMVDVTERLLGKGFEIRIYDRNVSMSRLIGANREYILQHVPHIAGLLVDSLDEVAAFAEVVLVGNASDEFSPLLSRLKPDQRVIDLVRVRNHPSGGNYEGIAW